MQVFVSFPQMSRRGWTPPPGELQFEHFASLKAKAITRSTGSCNSSQGYLYQCFAVCYENRAQNGHASALFQAV
jgi:hypothetical protein